MGIGLLSKITQQKLMLKDYHAVHSDNIIGSQLDQKCCLFHLLIDNYWWGPFGFLPYLCSYSIYSHMKY